MIKIIVKDRVRAKEPPFLFTYKNLKQKAQGTKLKNVFSFKTNFSKMLMLFTKFLISQSRQKQKNHYTRGRFGGSEGRRNHFLELILCYCFDLTSNPFFLYEDE